MTPEYKYRKLTMSDFSADILNQLLWAINLTDSTSNLIINAINNSTPEAVVSDAGEMVSSYTMSGNVYKASLNLGSIVGDKNIGALNINITRQQLSGRDYYDLVKLEGDLKFVSVINLHFNLDHNSLGNQVDFSIVDTNISRVNANV